MRKYLPLIVILAAAVAGILVGYFGFRRNNPGVSGPTVSVTFLDVKRGAGIIIKTPESQFAVIDPGPETEAQNLIGYLKWMGATAVDVIVTNPDRDHMGALPALFDALNVKRVIHGPRQEKLPIWRNLLPLMADRNIESVSVNSGSSIVFSSTSSIEVLSPPSSFLPDTKPTSEDNSLVLQLRYGHTRFLLPPDAGTATEAYLISLGDKIESEILMVPRSAKHDSCSLEFISSVHPMTCVLTCGDRLGSPNSSVLARIDAKKSGAQLYRTDKDGTIVVISDGNHIGVDTHADTSD